MIFVLFLLLLGNLGFLFWVLNNESYAILVPVVMVLDFAIIYFLVGNKK